MASPKISGVEVCLFDAYGTLFDVHSAAERCRAELGENADRISATWRTKQLQYSWLRSLMREYAPFWQVTGEALDYALAESGVADPATRGKLMDLYLALECYPEVTGVLETLRGHGMRTGVLSNGSPDMLDAAVANAGVDALFDAVLSVDSLGIYKPDPAVYDMAAQRFDCEPGAVCFMSSNAWDAYAASNFGFQTVWVNRFEQPPENIPAKPSAEIRTLDALPSLLD